ADHTNTGAHQGREAARDVGNGDQDLACVGPSSSTCELPPAHQGIDASVIHSPWPFFNLLHTPWVASAMSLVCTLARFGQEYDPRGTVSDRVVVGAVKATSGRGRYSRPLSQIPEGRNCRK